MTLSAHLTLSTLQIQVLKVAHGALEQARSSVGIAGPHHSLGRLRFTAATFFEITLMAVLPCALLWWVKPELMQFWHEVIIGWAELLQIPLVLAGSGSTEEFQWLYKNSAALTPSLLMSVMTTALVIAIYASTFWMSDRQVPLKYLLRTLCVIQASALVFFMYAPSRFPYAVPGHVAALLQAGYYLMLAVPVMLALGWGVLRVPLYQKLLYPSLMLLYFAFMLPHKALLHALVLQHFSVLFMPVLYLCFGSIFDVMVFVALYSWLASGVRAGALNQEALP